MEFKLDGSSFSVKKEAGYLGSSSEWTGRVLNSVKGFQ